MTKVDFRSSTDTGNNDEASIQPITNSDATIAEALGRPDQRLRERTVELQAQHNAERLIRLYSQGYTITATAAATLTQWEGAYNGSSLGRILMTGGADLVLLPMLGPGVTRSASPALDDGDTNISATRYGYTDVTFDNGGGDFAVVRIVFDTTVTPGSSPWTALDPLAAAWMTVSVVVSGSGVSATLGGTDPESEQLGLVPGEAQITITAGSTTTATALAAALPGLLPDVVLSATVIDGDGSSTVTAIDRQVVTSEPLVGHALRITSAMLQSFFSASTENRLRKGDTLAVHFGTDTERLTASALGRWSSLSANNLVNVGRYPVYASKCIPIARVDMLDRLIWVGGAVQASGATTSFFPGTSKSVFSPSAIAKDDFTIGAGSVDAQINSLANVVQGVLDGDYPFHDFQQDASFNQGIYAPQFRAGLTYGGGQEINGAAGVFESRGTGRFWAHTDTDTDANPGTMYQLRVDSDRSGNTGQQFSLEVGKSSSQSEASVGIRLRKQGAANLREFWLGNPVDGLQTFVFPADDDALASAHIVTAVADGITAAAGFGPSTVYRTSAYAGNEPTSIVDQVRVGGARRTSTDGRYYVSARTNSALANIIIAGHGNSYGVEFYNSALSTNSVVNGLTLVAYNASRDDGHGVRLSLCSETSETVSTEIGAVYARYTDVSDGDSTLYLSCRTAGVEDADVSIDGLGLHVANAVDATGTVTTTSASGFVGHNVAYAFAQVSYSGGSYSYVADTVYGFATGTAITNVSGPGVPVLTLTTALPQGSGKAVVLVNTTTNFITIASGVASSSTQITVRLYDVVATGGVDTNFNVVVYAMR